MTREEEITTLIDDYVVQLSKMQVGLLRVGIPVGHYNEISDRIGDLKEYLINCEIKI